MKLADLDDDLLEFCAPWLARDPRLALACQFAPAGAARARLLASSVLARELAEAAMTVSDRRVAEAKLGWWAEESALWMQGQPRHPLARGFDPRANAAALASLAVAGREWLDAPPAADVDALQQRLRVLAAGSAALAGTDAAAIWEPLWLALGLRLSLDARAPLASLLPMDLLARHGLRRSQWPELDNARRLPVLADLARRVAPVPAQPEDPGLAALLVLERRWLQRLAHAGADRVGFLDTIAAWRAARAALKLAADAARGSSH